MNTGFGHQALNSVINVDWMHQLYAGETKPLDPGQSSSTMEMVESSIINTANKQSRLIATPAIDSSGIGFYDLAAATKSEPELRRVAVSPINSNLSAAGNISALQKFSSALHRGLWAATASGLSRGGGVVKVKKKRERRSRCVPTKLVKTDTSNFKAMVQHFTGFPHPTVTTDESTLAPAEFSYSPQSIISASSTSFSKPLPHPNVCKNSNSSTLPKYTTSTATSTCASPLLPPNYFPTYQSMTQLPFISAAASITSLDHLPTSAHPKEQKMVDATFLRHG